MRLTWSRLSSLMLLLLSTACEVHIGNADWDSGTWDDWDWNDDSLGDPWDSPTRDAGMSKGGSAAPATEEDGGTHAGAGGSGGSGGSASSSMADAAVPTNMIDAAVMSGETPDEPSFTIGMVAEVLARGSCGALSDCMGPELLQQSLRGMDCVDFRTKMYANRELYWLAKSVAYGRVTFRPDELTACERDLMSLRCEVQSRRLPESCRKALEGKADEDESCAIDQECAGKTYCNKGLMESCPGSCAPLQSAGLPCVSSDECSDGLVCRKGSCAVPLKEGEACTSHLGFGECAPGLVCQGASTATFTCRTIAAVYVGKVGDACDKTNKLCERDLVCQSQSSGVTGICAKPAGDGGVCRPSVPGQCPADHYCKDARANVAARAAAGTDGVCAALPSDGQACVAALGCKPGALCSTVDNKCHARKSVGDSCVENSECYSGACGETNGKCSAPLDCSP